MLAFDGIVGQGIIGHLFIVCVFRTECLVLFLCFRTRLSTLSSLLLSAISTTRIGDSVRLLFWHLDAFWMDLQRKDW